MSSHPLFELIPTSVDIVCCVHSFIFLFFHSFIHWTGLLSNNHMPSSMLGIGPPPRELMVYGENAHGTDSWCSTVNCSEACR